MTMMYDHSSVCMRQSRRPQRAVHCGRHPVHSRFDPLSLYGGLHGLSFDPTNTRALLSALQSMPGSLPTPSFSNPSSSTNSETNSFTRTDSCLAHAHDSSGSHTPEKRSLIREEFLREKLLHDKRLEDASSFLRQEGCHSVGQVTKLKDSNTNCNKSGKRKKDLTWIDWGWPGTHVACPFNQQRHVELDDSLIHPERCCEKEVMARMAVDVMELATSYVFIADMPGLKHIDVKVQVENDTVLRISGEWRREDAVQDGEVKYVRMERSSGKFMRKFNMPANANLDAISATCEDGMLTIILPKTPPPNLYRPRTFDVNVTLVGVGKA